MPFLTKIVTDSERCHSLTEIDTVLLSSGQGMEGLCRRRILVHCSLDHCQAAPCLDQLRRHEEVLGRPLKINDRSPLGVLYILNHLGAMTDLSALRP